MFTLDANTKVQHTYVNGWYDGIAAHRYGRYGSWTLLNYSCMTGMAVIDSANLYQGDGSFYTWSILWN
jgi:hypothetical protein